MGCGGVAQIIHLPILKKIPEISLEAICDIDIRKAAILASRFQVPHVAEDIEEMLHRCDLDAVFILTPNNMHLPMALIALEHGVHLFIEKPAARSGEEAQKIAAAAAANGCGVMVGMHSRFRQDVRAIKKALDKKGIGDVFFIKAEWLQARFPKEKQPWLLSKRIAGGGVVLDLGIQLLDAAWWLMQRPELKSVKAHAHQINPDIEVEDFCSFYLQFTNNLKLACHISWNFPLTEDRFSAEIFGKGGICRLNPFQIQRLWQGRSEDISQIRVPAGRVLFQRAYEAEIQHFVQFLTGKADKLESDIEDAIKVLSMVEAIYQSLETGQEVVF